MNRHSVPMSALAALITAHFFCSSICFAQTPQALPAQAASQAVPGQSAAISEPLTLPDAIRLALQFSPQIVANQQELAASEGALIQAGARPNPEIQALIEDTRRDSRTTTVQWHQPIELGGKRSARVSVAELARAQTAADMDGRRAQVRAEASDAFLAAAIAQERVALAQASAELAKRGADAVSKRVLAGKVSPVEETRAKVAQAGVRLELLQAQNELRAARQSLALLLGPASADRVQVLAWPPEVRPSLYNQTDASALMRNAPVMRQARLEIDKRQAMVKMERARAVPDVTLTLGAKRDEQVGRNQAVVGLAMAIPVLDTNRGNLLQALRLQDKAEADWQTAQIRTETEWAQLTARQSAAQAEVDMLQAEVLPGAESAWQAATIGFELGKFSFLDALDAQRTLLQARTQYLRARHELHRATAHIDRLLGAPSDDLTPRQP